MEKILYYDCFSGISGDMHLGAMIDLGLDPEYLKKELAKLKLDGFRLQITRELKQGIEGTKVKVLLDSPGQHHHHFSLFGKHHHHHHADFRNLPEIERIITNSNLSGFVKQRSLKMFYTIAEAEAKIHGKTINDIHFHEVGALDAIVDICGAAIAIDYFKPSRIICSPVELGSGMIHCEHGKFPVPAPATAEILKNIPVKIGGTSFEATTPTGATILAVNVDEFTSSHNLTIEKTAYGLGEKNAEVPNVLRVMICNSQKQNTGISAQLPPLTNYQTILLSCNIDDMNPEHYEFVMEKLFAAGADDVYFVPIVMKKSRPAITIEVLCNKNHEAEMMHILYTQTSTLGIRKSYIDKHMLERLIIPVKTKWGEVRIKAAIFEKTEIKAKPEYEDCKKIAIQNNLSIKQVSDEAMLCYMKTKEVH